MKAATRAAIARKIDVMLAECDGPNPHLMLTRPQAAELLALLGSQPTQRIQTRPAASRQGKANRRPGGTLKGRATPIPAAVKRRVLDRADEQCEACGLPMLHAHLHHRKLRSQGGKHTVANLIAIHPSCHDRIHQGSREVAERLGLIVPGKSNEALIPVIPELFRTAA